jgi:hypothetical protein
MWQIVQALRLHPERVDVIYDALMLVVDQFGEERPHTETSG